MKTKAKPPLAGKLTEARRGFDQWRRGRDRLGPIPEHLWKMAAEAAAIHGVRATARRLRLNATKLKKWVQTLAQGQASKDEARFVEVPWLGPTAVPECILEAEDPVGKKLRIHLKGEATSQAVSLGRMLWSEAG